MFTYHSANTSAAQPALVNAIEQGLRAELGVVTEDDILMELTKWVEASDNDILSDIYQQTINYVVSGQHPTLENLLCCIGNLRGYVSFA
ncbi:biofilm-dependent modulation protein [Salmonella enterica]|nr:biofilm-dependent modulation protein [Salmonella enterica]